MDVVENKGSLKEFYGEHAWEVFKIAIRNCGIRWQSVMAEAFAEIEKENIPIAVKNHFDSALFVAVITNMLTFKYLTLATQNRELAKQTIEIDLMAICESVRQGMTGKIVEEFLEENPKFQADFASEGELKKNE